MKSIKSKLIKIADELDRRGHGDLATEIDKNILPEIKEEIEIEIPEEELKELKEILFSLRESLNDKIT